MEKDILVAPSADEPKSLVGQPLDRAFCHLVATPKNVSAACPKLVRSDCSTANQKVYPMGWLHQLAARDGEKKETAYCNEPRLAPRRRPVARFSLVRVVC